jgi:hypothetical protein
MSERERLIARKLTVRREIERVQRELSRMQVTPGTQQRRIRSLETQLDRLMAEEHTLRLAIDGAPGDGVPSEGVPSEGAPSEGAQ